MPSFTCMKQWGFLGPDWYDSVSGILGNDGFIHLIGSAHFAIAATNDHWVLDPSDLSIVHHISAPWNPIGETGLSKLLGGNKIVRCGGAGGTAFDAWLFDPSVAGYTAGSWSEIIDDASSQTGDRRMAAHVDFGTEHFIFGGWNNDTYCKTSDFLTYTTLGTLPTNIKRISGCAYGEFGGKIRLIGGSTEMATGGPTEFLSGRFRGGNWSYTPGTNTFTQESADSIPNFGTCWCDFGKTASQFYVGRGYNSPLSADFIPEDGNKRGVLISTDGVTFTEMSPLLDGRKAFYERHRASYVQLDANRLLMAGGFAANGAWIYDET